MKRKTGNKLILCAVIAAVICLIAVPSARSAAVEGRGDSVHSIYDTVMERALQCYVIEGAYPMSLEYLEENYGLTVNRKDYLISYLPYAENLPPDVQVIDRKASDNR